MRRREFIGLVGIAAVAWPLAARAQQAGMPVIGFLNGGSPDGYATYVTGFLHGLNETGYVEGKNVTVYYEWARGQYDRLQVMAAHLVYRKVAVIAVNTPAAPVAKAATTEIPIVFVSTGDPVMVGLVTSFNRPGGNVTGVGLLGLELEGKRLGLLHQFLPGITPIGVLVNPANPAADLQLRELQKTAGVIKRQIDIVRAGTALDIERAFAIAAQQGASALLVVQDPFYTTIRLRAGAYTGGRRRPDCFARPGIAAICSRSSAPSGVCTSASNAFGILHAPIRRYGWLLLLRSKFYGNVPTRSGLRGPHRKGRQAG
jgi:putative ABC transport system substrate-binding protein